MIYDRGKYHDKTVKEAGLPQSHASNHTVVFLRWICERGMLSDDSKSDAAKLLDKIQRGSATYHDLYKWFDRTLSDDYMNAEGAAFTDHYYNLERGKYIGDYIATLGPGHATEFHIPFNEENYLKMRALIDRRYREWKQPPARKSWWPFGTRC